MLAELAETKNVKFEFIPAGLTSFLQPADVAWMKAVQCGFQPTLVRLVYELL
jgi:hypothetical protein